MAEEKKKEEGAEETKKKGLPAIVLIAVGAIVGGAGVVFAIPPKTVEVEKPAPKIEQVDVTNPDLIKIEFNPRTRSGKGVARVSFKFVYTIKQAEGAHDVEDAAFELIKDNWDALNSKVLFLFKTRSMEELQSEAGLRMLEHDLIQELDRTVFPDHGHGKTASVSRILWKDMLLQ